MPTLLDYIFDRNLKNKLPEKAHFIDKQWIHDALTWKEGAEALKTLFPKDARSDRPARWYELLRKTHWPGTVPPGNGPFYVPDWALLSIEYDHAQKVREILKGANFKEKDVPVAFIPATSEYLHGAMRVAENYKWNVNPVLYQVYWYPWMGKGREQELRPFSTDRWLVRA